MIMTGVLIALGACVVLVVIVVKVFGRYLFENPCEGDGNYNPPMDMFYYEEPESEDDTKHRR